MTREEALDDANSTPKRDATANTSRNWSFDGSSAPTPVEQEPETVVSFPGGDPEDPYNWPWKRKIVIVLVVLNTVFNASISSALPSGASGPLSSAFNIHDDEKLVVPISAYLVGYCFGPLFWGPLSETFGRKAVMIPAFGIFSVFTLACALSPSFAALCVFRLLVGLGAACAITVVGGVFADIYGSPVSRGKAMAAFMAGNTFGPILGPVVAGFASTVSWHWCFWIALIYSGVSFVPLVFMPETYGPVLLKRRAIRMRRQNGECRAYAPIEMETKGWKQIATVILTRPIRMYLFEALVFFSCTYLALIFGILYLYFEAYPLIFQGIYGMSPGVSALCFLPIGIGALIAGSVFVWYDNILIKAKARNKVWAFNEESRRLPLACIGGPVFAGSLFWLGWGANKDVHWIVPTLSGLPFGLGMLLSFMSLVNYLTDAYEIYAASVNAASSTTRSIFGAVLPFAASPMYRRLGVHWATSLLGLFSLAMSGIPFIFYWKGKEIRQRSRMCQDLARRKAEKGGRANETHINDEDEVHKTTEDGGEKA